MMCLSTITYIMGTFKDSKMCKLLHELYGELFCFNNIAKKSFPGTPPGLVSDLAIRGCWTSHRWSRTFCCYHRLISGPRAFV